MEGNVLRISLLKADMKGSNLPTVDPKSLSLLGYAKLYQYHMVTPFKVELEQSIDGDLVPSVSFEGKKIYEIEEFRTTSCILENLRGIPPNSVMATTERLINNVEKVCIRGLRRLQPRKQLWQLKDTEEESELLRETVENSFRDLSEMLGDNAYLLNMYYDEGETYPSYLDAKFFGAGIIIYKCFGSSGDQYCSSVCDLLKSWLNLDAYFDRMDSQLILSLSYNREFSFCLVL